MSDTAPIHYSDLWQGIARAVPERTAVVTAGDRVSWGRLHAEASALAAAFEACGVTAGEAVGTLLYNRHEFLSLVWASLSLGIAPVAINYRYRASEIRDLLIDSDSRVFVVPSSLGAIAAEAAEGLDIQLVTVDDGGEPVAGAMRYEDIVAGGGRMPEAAPRGADMRLYTGGTTGSPKAVVWDMDTLLVARRHSTWQLIGVDPPATLADAVAIAAEADAPPVVTLPLSPLLHGTAQSATMATMALGGTVVLHAHPRMDMDAVYDLIVSHGVTRLIVAGDVLALPLVETAERAHGLPSVTSVVSSGMRFSDDTKRRLHRLGDMTIVDMFASSEGGPYALGISSSAEELPVPLRLSADAVLLDEDGAELPLEAGTLGLVAFRGVLPRGYYGDPVKTEATFRRMNGHRYVVPGDWARARGDGTIDLLGRLSAVVNTGGEKVFPAEVEQALLSHPGLDDAVVFGMPDARFGEVVCAMVAPAAGVEVDVDAVIEYVGTRLAGYKKPRHLFVRESLERSATGKIVLDSVKAEAAAELAASAVRTAS